MKPWFKVGNYFIDYRTDRKIDLDPIEACKLTINYIMENYPSPYNIMVSGGVDSQAMLYAWKLFGKSFIPTSVTYNKSLNLDDLETLKLFSDKENISIKFIDFDLIDYFKTKHDYIAFKYQSPSPQISSYIGMTYDLPGTIVFADQLHFTKTSGFDHIQRSLYNYSLEKSVVPYFFSHTAELTYSALGDLVNIGSKYEDKAQKYNLHGFPVISQDKAFKNTGFENVKKFYDENFPHLVTPYHKLIAGKYRHNNRVFDLLFRFPYYEKIGIFKYQHLW